MNSAENSTERVSTGLQGLDEILDSLRIGDNVVWRIDSIADYRAFVTPFVRTSLQEGKRVVYMRFGRHEPLVQPAPNVIYKLDALRGFASASAIITGGRGAFYVFDCLRPPFSVGYRPDDRISSGDLSLSLRLDTVATALCADHSFKTTPVARPPRS
jgi:hypothetical protein